MKAVVQERYGGPEALRIAEVERPVAAAGEVVVRVRAAAVNAYDWHIMRGDPYVARLLGSGLGLRGPKARIRGRDLAGVVDTVGPGVTGFEVGDEVYGDLGEVDGAFAEYASIPVDRVSAKPAGLTFEQAAAMPLAANTALVGMRDVGAIDAGRRVLINGASGGVGTFAVQIAKALGGEVTGVCSTRNVELVGSLGADHVVDYTRADFTRDGRTYDVVLDLVGNRSLGDLRRALSPNGTLILSGGGTSHGGSVLGPMGLMIRGQVVGRFIRQRVVPLTPTPSAANLVTLSELVEAGRLSPAVDRTFPLDKVADAIRYVEVEHASAKVVLTV